MTLNKPNMNEHLSVLNNLKTILLYCYEKSKDMKNKKARTLSNIAEIDEAKDFLVAMGNVVVVSDSGVTLYTDTLSWDNVDEKVFTDCESISFFIQ